MSLEGKLSKLSQLISREILSKPNSKVKAECEIQTRKNSIHHKMYKFLFQDPLWGINLDGKQISVGHQGLSLSSIAKHIFYSNKYQNSNSSGLLSKEGRHAGYKQGTQGQVQCKDSMNHLNTEFQRANTLTFQYIVVQLLLWLHMTTMEPYSQIESSMLSKWS